MAGANPHPPTRDPLRGYPAAAAGEGERSTAAAPSPACGGGGQPAPPVAHLRPPLRAHWPMLVVLALFGSLISLYYYLIVLKAVFVDEAAGELSAIIPAPLQRVSLTLAAAVIFIGGILPTNLINRIVGSLH